MKSFAKIALATVLAAGALSAQAKVANNANYGAWKGVCDKSGTCGVAQIGKNDQGKNISMIAIRKMTVKQNGKDVTVPVMMVTVPLGVSLQAGMGVGIDNKRLGVTRYDFCIPNGCHALMPLNATVTTALRKGNKLEIGMVFIGGATKQVNANFSLKGISSALDKL